MLLRFLFRTVLLGFITKILGRYLPLILRSFRLFR
jgi:hypothetical protein